LKRASEWRWLRWAEIASVALSAAGAGLSPREKDVTPMTAKALTNEKIARVLLIGQFTVRTHVKHILQKLEASVRTEAISIAMQQGILSVTS
jgi:DNA-binding CsgD family transcriptional regulator